MLDIYNWFSDTTTLWLAWIAASATSATTAITAPTLVVAWVWALFDTAAIITFFHTLII